MSRSGFGVKTVSGFETLVGFQGQVWWSDRIMFQDWGRDWGMGQVLGRGGYRVWGSGGDCVSGLGSSFVVGIGFQDVVKIRIVFQDGGSGLDFEMGV